MAKTEYDSRVLGVNRLGSNNEIENAKMIGNYFVEKIGGFTEIPPDAMVDLFPGVGSGYVIGLEDSMDVVAIENGFVAQAEAIKCGKPGFTKASTGNRKGYCYFLIPFRANPVKERSHRRLLFNPDRMNDINQAITNEFPGSYHNQVYGEWKSDESDKGPTTDDSYMFVFPPHSGATKEKLIKFIRKHLFDDEECDQSYFYLSVDGTGFLVAPVIIL